MSDILSELIGEAIFSVLGGIADHFRGNRPRLKFAVLSWSLTFHQDRDDDGDNQHVAESPPASAAEPIARYSLRFRVYNKNEESTGLQQFSVQFTKGPRFDTTVIFNDSEPVAAAGDAYSSGVCTAALTEMKLPAREYAVQEIAGVVEWTEALRQADCVWLIASTAGGGRFRWRVAQFRAQTGRQAQAEP